ncbi:hypothetical protein [Lunatimonas salinarum]|uniref:hypothetical protein n=1 Tax=Lunatimonas salinarum TaxID=1774590 RepID=UPI001ADEFD68|nr:hypothetical protein [Lunatimonas salinarum]
MRTICILYFVFFSSFIGFSQDKSLFDGLYEFKGRRGHATFEFSEGVDGEILLDGFFSFDRKELDSLDQTLLTKFQVRGTYTENLKSGSWHYDQERHKVILEDVVDFKLISKLESDDLEIKASYQDGKPHGEWQLVKNIFNGNKADIRALAEGIHFEEGVMKGNVSYRNFLNGYTQFIRGKLDSNGFLEGEWSLVYVQDSRLVSEVRNYENGFLLGLVKRDLENGEVIDEVIFFTTIRKLSEVNEGGNLGYRVSDKAFPPYYNDGFSPDAKELQLQEAGNNFMRAFFLDLLRFDDSVTDDGEIMRYPFFTRRFEYELSEEERNLLVEIPLLFDQVRDSVKRFTEMNSLDLNRSKSDSLAFSHAYFGQASERLDAIHHLVDLISTGEIRYFDLGNYTESGVEILKEADAVTYVYQDDTLSKSISREHFFVDATNLLATLRDYLLEELEIVEDLGGFVTKELYAIAVNSQLVALETSIVSRKAEMDTLFVNYHAMAEGEEEAFCRAFVGQFMGNVYESLNEEYASRVDFESKMDAGTIILDLFDELEKRYPMITTLFKRDGVLDEVYMEETFNPFTYSRYDVRAKERLFLAYRYLYKQYQEDLLQEPDYTRIKDHIGKIEKLQDRMYELRDQDSRAIERRLGTRQTVSRIESALDL